MKCRTYYSASLLPLLLLLAQFPDLDLASESGAGSCLAIAAYTNMVRTQLVGAVKSLD